MYMAQAKTRRFSPTWTWMNVLSVACLVVSLLAAAGAVQGLVTDLKGYKPFKHEARSPSLASNGFSPSPPLPWRRRLAPLEAGGPSAVEQNRRKAAFVSWIRSEGGAGRAATELAAAFAGVLRRRRQP
ncbi:hypothetical protein PR202_ga28425 [Eleusine coracana subsp. coracana]|uniref:Uncharacterized protein n=1 Tax=Eleusine coracana subsp. coracana TaxID=191504 RepID=A0AAV5DJ28_ELECO|nr:hypothetical protein PR202_ga28425 [Eleusine coracana subsp. coracana]